MPTETIEHIEGGFKANPLEVQLAKAAQAAIKEGKDPYAAAKIRLNAMGLDEAPEAEAKPDVRRYLLAVCRLGSGQFEHLNDADLMDVAALVKLSFHSLEQWEDVREQA